MSELAQTDRWHRRIDWTACLMGVSFALMWGSAFTSAKIALADAPPFLMLTVRFAISGLIAVIWAWLLGQRIPRAGSMWRVIIIFGLCQNSLYLGLNFLAMTMVPAGLAAIIASALPLAVAMASTVLFKTRLAPLAVIGLVAGFAGVIFIMAGRIEGGASVLGIALCIAGLIALAVATLTVRSIDVSDQLMMVVGLQMIVGSVALLPMALAFESSSDVTFTWSLGLAFAYTTLLPGLAATLIWFRLVARVGATNAATYHFLNPVFGVFVAGILLGETLGWVDWIGVCMVTISILLVQAGGRSHRQGTG